MKLYDSNFSKVLFRAFYSVANYFSCSKEISHTIECFCLFLLASCWACLRRYILLFFFFFFCSIFRILNNQTTTDWQPNDNQLTTIWQPFDNHLTANWQPFDNQMLSNVWLELTISPILEYDVFRLLWQFLPLTKLA